MNYERHDVIMVPLCPSIIDGNRNGCSRIYTKLVMKTAKKKKKCYVRMAQIQVRPMAVRPCNSKKKI